MPKFTVTVKREFEFTVEAPSAEALDAALDTMDGHDWDDWAWDAKWQADVIPWPKALEEKCKGKPCDCGLVPGERRRLSARWRLSR